MRKHLPLAMSTLLVALSGTLAVAQDRGRDRQDNHENNQGNYQFNQHDQQATHDWYRQNQSHPPAGFRSQDRLSSDEESRIHEGAVLDRGLRRKVHPAPADLYRQLAPPPARHRYVVVGNHVALVDNSYHVRSVIHLHDDH